METKEILRVLDKADGKLLPIAEAVSEVVGETVPKKRARRWATDGLQGRSGVMLKLDSVLVGMELRTTANAVRRFLTALQHKGGKPARAPGVSRQGAKDVLRSSSRK